VIIMDIESNTRMLSTMNDPTRMGRVTGGAVCDCLANTVAAPGVLLRQLLVVVTVLEKISWCLSLVCKRGQYKVTTMMFPGAINPLKGGAVQPIISIGYLHLRAMQYIHGLPSLSAQRLR
jgi:cobalamin synthase